MPHIDHMSAEQKVFIRRICETKTVACLNEGKTKVFALSGWSPRVIWTGNRSVMDWAEKESLISRDKSRGLEVSVYLATSAARDRLRAICGSAARS